MTIQDKQPMTKPQKIEGGMSKWTPKLKTIDLELADFPDITSKYTERLANKRAKAIDDFIGGYIPKWQVKIMLRFPFMVKLFGWTIEERPNWNEMAEKFGQKIELKRYGKFVMCVAEKVEELVERVNILSKSK